MHHSKSKRLTYNLQTVFIAAKWWHEYCLLYSMESEKRDDSTMRRSIEYIDSNILSGLEAEGKIMKRDKKFVIFIVFISIAITVVLQYSHSPEVRRMVPYLTALERSLSAHGEGNANEFHSVNNPFKPVTGDDVIPVEYFIEEQRIIEEFTNEKQFKRN